jgi:hypothetical protein
VSQPTTFVRAPLACLSEDPADRLTDEEPALFEHRIGTAPEPLERRSGLQRLQLGQQRRANPEIRIGSPSVKDRLGFDRMSCDDRAGHVPRQPVDERPGARLSDESFKQH